MCDAAYGFAPWKRKDAPQLLSRNCPDLFLLPNPPTCGTTATEISRRTIFQQEQVCNGPRQGSQQGNDHEEGDQAPVVSYGSRGCRATRAQCQHNACYHRCATAANCSGHAWQNKRSLITPHTTMSNGRRANTTAYHPEDEGTPDVGDSMEQIIRLMATAGGHHHRPQRHAGTQHP